MHLLRFMCVIHTLPTMMTRILILCVLTALAASAGCVEREMTITSEPEGALVYISDVEIGRTPVTIPFTWYGDYEIILRLEGYETLKTSRDITPPWYEIPPADLLSELAPWTYRDERFLHFVLERYEGLDKDELLERAEELRRRNLEPVK